MGKPIFETNMMVFDARLMKNNWGRLIFAHGIEICYSEDSYLPPIVYDCLVKKKPNFLEQSLVECFKETLKIKLDRLMFQGICKNGDWELDILV